MAQFSVKPDNIYPAADAEDKIVRELDKLESEIRHISTSLGFRSSAKVNIQRRLNGAAGRISGHRGSMNSMRSALCSVADVYNRTEDRIADRLDVGNVPIQNVQEERCNNKVGQVPKKTDLSGLWKIVGAFGPGGKVVSTVCKAVTSDKEPIAKWADAASGMWKAVCKTADAVKKCKKDSDVNWMKEIFGLNKDSILKDIKKTDSGRFQKALQGWNKKIKGELGEFKTNYGRVKQVGGTLFSLFSNGISNYEEYEKKKNTAEAISAERAAAETISETVVDWAKDLLIGAGITAGLAAAGVAAPAFAVGAATIAVSAASDWISEKIFGEKVTELVSDGILDFAEGVGNMFKTGAKKAKESTTAIWKNITNSWKSLTGGRKLQFA